MPKLTCFSPQRRKVRRENLKNKEFRNHKVTPKQKIRDSGCWIKQVGNANKKCWAQALNHGIFFLNHYQTTLLHYVE